MRVLGHDLTSHGSVPDSTQNQTNRLLTDLGFKMTKGILISCTVPPGNSTTAPEASDHISFQGDAISPSLCRCCHQPLFKHTPNVTFNAQSTAKATPL